MNESVPRTAGELRSNLAEIGDPWTVDPALADDDPLPERPGGGQTDDEVPAQSRLTVLDVSADLVDLLAASPPANPSLRQRWAEVGLLAPDTGSGS